MNNKHIMKGITIAAIASAIWGISGTTIQFISQNQNLPVAWYLSVRTLGAGTILLLISLLLYRKQTFAIFKDKTALAWLLAYATLGLMANLLTFYLAIQTGNASTATVLQYLSPLFIVIGALVFKRQTPMKTDLIAFIISLLGVVLVITKGDFTQLAISVESLLWGIGSGITAAFYIVLPRPLAKDYSPIITLGWGTFIAGILFNLYNPVWVGGPKLTLPIILSVSTVIIFGTIIPFALLLYSARFAPSDVIGIMDALQPVTTTILSVIFLKLSINVMEVIGICLVIIAIYVLQRGRRNLEVVNYREADF